MGVDALDVLEAVQWRRSWLFRGRSRGCGCASARHLGGISDGSFRTFVAKQVVTDIEVGLSADGDVWQCGVPICKKVKCKDHSSIC